MSRASGPRFVTRDDLESPALMAECISAIESRLAKGWEVTEPARSSHQVGDGHLLLMPGWDDDFVAVKINTLLPGGYAENLPRVQGVFVIFELPRMTPAMMVDAAGITALRTPAMSAVATKHLARTDASRLVVFGTGPQAVRHVEAMRLVRTISSVGIVGRTRESAERLAADLRDSGVPAAAVSSDIVADADVVCTCTTSRTPVFDGSLLSDRVHVNAVGSHEPTVRELDDATFRGATVAVDSLEMALQEAGDVVMALNSGAIPSVADVLPLSAIVGEVVSTSGATRTIFKSVGTAGQDLVAGELLLKVFTSHN